MWGALIYDDAEPETEACNVDCSFLYIHSIDVVGDDFCLQGCIIAFEEITLVIPDDEDDNADAPEDEEGADSAEAPVADAPEEPAQE